MTRRLFGWIRSRTNSTIRKQGKVKPPKRLLNCEFLEQRAAPTDTISMLLGLGFTFGGMKLLGDRLASPTFGIEPQALRVTGQEPTQLSRAFPAKPPEGAAGDSDPPRRSEPIHGQNTGSQAPLATNFGGDQTAFNQDPFNLFADAKPAAPHGGGAANLANQPSPQGGGGSSSTGAAPDSGHGGGSAAGGGYAAQDYSPHGGGPSAPEAPNAGPASAARSTSAGTVSAATDTVTAASESDAGDAKPGHKGKKHGSGNDPMIIVDVNKGVVVTPGVTEQEFSSWSMDLRAQVSGATASTYSWSTTNAPDATSISGASSFDLTFTWASFTGAARTDTITLTETNTDTTQNIQTLTFRVTATNSPAYSSAVTTSSTWPNVLPPDAVQMQQETAGAGPYYSLGLQTGELDISHTLAGYNPSVAPLSLLYNSTTGSAQPIFMTHFPIDSTRAVPSTVSSQLTFNGTAGTQFYYSTSSLNPGDILQIAGQANATSLATGRYSYSEAVTANYATPVTTTYSGSVDIINSSSSPFGAGWSLSGLEHIWSVTGGVILELSGGTSLWFASAGGGSFTTPAGDFSTLTQNIGTSVYTRTLTDGTTITFNSSGYQTAVTDRDGRTTDYAYNGSNQLSTITDFNNQITTFSYGTNQVTITDPASRVTTLTLASGQLAGITDPDGAAWSYGYDGANDLTTTTDPRSKVTTFAYNFADRVTTVTRADSTTELLTALQMQGLVPSGSGTLGSPATPVLTAQAQSTYTDPRSNAWTSRSDWLGFGRATQAIDPLGDTAVTYRDANGLGYLSSDPLGNRTRYNFDSSGNTTKLTLPDLATPGDSVQTFTYNSFAEQTTATDPTGFVTTFQYNAHGDLTTLTNALSEVTTYQYTSLGFLTTMIDARGNTTRYGYDSLNRQTTTTDPLGNITTMTYDAASNVLTVKDALSNVTSYTYDAMGRMLTKQVPEASTAIYTYTYDAAGNQVTSTDALGNVTTTVYDSLNRQTAVIDNLGHATTYSYDSAGNLTTLTDALNRTTVYTFDAANRLTNVKDSNGFITTYTLDADGNQLTVKDPLTNITTYTYNARNWLSTVLTPAGVTTTYNYDVNGSQTALMTTKTAQTDGPASENWTYTYNTLHQVVTATDPLGQVTTYQYDHSGNLTTTTNALNLTSVNRYDSQNRLTTIIDSNGDTTVYGYDAVGNRTTVTDPLGRVTTYVYDARQRVVAMIDPRAGRTTYTYDQAGRQTSITDPVGNTTTYVYDQASRLVNTINPLGSTATYSYDAANHLTTVTDYANRTIAYQYDSGGRLTTEIWNPSSPVNTVVYKYDNDNRLLSEQDASSKYTYSYDKVGNLLSADNNGTPSMPRFILTYTYGTYNDVLSVTDNFTGGVTYTYNGDHMLTALSLHYGFFTSQGPQVTLSYDAGNRLTGTTRWVTGTDKILSTQTYDNANRLSTLTYNATHTGVGALATYVYHYDNASQLTTYTGPDGTSFAQTTLTYTYDAAGELTNVGDGRLETYTYDNNGNRTMTGYTTGTGNRLTADGTFTYAYDANGNMSSKTRLSDGETWTYTWDFRNRLTNVTEKTSANATVNNETFTYDVENRRIGDNLNGTLTWTGYDGQNPYADLNSTGSLTYWYVHGRAVDSIFARFDNTPSSHIALWHLGDLLGSVREYVKTDGTVQDRISYDSYGNIVNESNAANGDRFKYTGREWDSTFAMQFNRARYYIPTDGRWISQDQLGFEAGDANLYRYVLNAPVSALDPTGNDIVWGAQCVKGGEYVDGAVHIDDYREYIPYARFGRGRLWLDLGAYTESNDRWLWGHHVAFAHVDLLVECDSKTGALDVAEQAGSKKENVDKDGEVSAKIDYQVEKIDAHTIKITAWAAGSFNVKKADIKIKVKVDKVPIEPEVGQTDKTVTWGPITLGSWTYKSIPFEFAPFELPKSSSGKRSD
jgi:RHS repeat-associated protein